MDRCFFEEEVLEHINKGKDINILTAENLAQKDILCSSKKRIDIIDWM